MATLKEGKAGDIVSASLPTLPAHSAYSASVESRITIAAEETHRTLFLVFSYLVTSSTIHLFVNFPRQDVG
jgi:hypothetical protein